MYINLSLLIFLLWDTSNAQSFNVYVNTSSSVRSVPDKFLSISFDSSNADSPNWRGLNFSYIEPLASALKPVYFRFGGTAANFVTFQATSTNKNGAKIGDAWSGNFTITGAQFDQLYTFTKNAGWRLIFDLSDLFNRNSTNEKLDLSNAKLLIDYASSKGYDLDFELGNEPDCISPRISGAQIAQDYQALRSLLNSYDVYKNSIIIGPSPCSPDPRYLGEFLNNSGGNYINGLSFHQYYMAGASSTLQDFINPATFDKLKGEINEVVKLGYSSNWLGETSTAYNGGGVNLSNTFVAGYLWLDKLGLSALHGLDVVVRQQLYGSYQIGLLSHYCLLDMTMSPTPDYWLSFLYKKLVGQTVFSLTFTPSNVNLRMYAASQVNNNGFIIYGFSLSNDSFTIDLPQLSTKQVTAYVVTPNEPGNLQSFLSQLNGETLVWNSHQPILNIKGNVASLPLTLPGFSQFFISIGQTKSQGCLDGWTQEKTTANKCIKILNQTQPWFVANFDCSVYSPNATLLSITSSFENAEILQLSSNVCNRLYIGLYRSGNNFIWSNNNPSSYRNWRIGFPNNDQTQNCVTFDQASGNWLNSDCDVSQCFICEQYI